jgi:hypothetical protein
LQRPVADVLKYDIGASVSRENAANQLVPGEMACYAIITTLLLLYAYPEAASTLFDAFCLFYGYD